MKPCVRCDAEVDVNNWCMTAISNPVYCWECFKQRIVESDGFLRRCQYCAYTTMVQFGSQRPIEPNTTVCDDCRSKKRSLARLRST